MKFSFYVVMALLISINSFAGAENEGFDYSISGGAQSYPLGGLISIDSGYGVKVWDKTAEGEAPAWQYGYVRPVLEIDTAAILNRGAIAVELFPISIFGVAAGAGTSLRTSNYYQDFNCNDLQCAGQLNYQFLRARFLAGVGKALISVNAKYEKFKSNEDIKPFYEEMSYLIGRTGEDDLRTLEVLTGMKLSDFWTLGVRGVFQEFIHSGNNTSSIFLAGNYTENFWQASLGIGQFKSSHQTSNFATLISISYTGRKGLSLLD